MSDKRRVTPEVFQWVVGTFDQGQDIVRMAREGAFEGREGEIPGLSDEGPPSPSHSGRTPMVSRKGIVVPGGLLVILAVVLTILSAASGGMIHYVVDAGARAAAETEVRQQAELNEQKAKVLAEQERANAAEAKANAETEARLRFEREAFIRSQQDWLKEVESSENAMREEHLANADMMFELASEAQSLSDEDKATILYVVKTAAREMGTDHPDLWDAIDKRLEELLGDTDGQH